MSLVTSSISVVSFRNHRYYRSLSEDRLVLLTRLVLEVRMCVLIFFLFLKKYSLRFKKTFFNLTGEVRASVTRRLAADID